MNKDLCYALHVTGAATWAFFALWIAALLLRLALDALHRGLAFAQALLYWRDFAEVAA